MKNAFTLLIAIVLFGSVIHKGAASGGDPVSLSCDDCYSIRGELKRTTKFSVLSSDALYTIIELSNGQTYVSADDLTLGPVSAEVEIVARHGLDRFPRELQRVYKNASTAETVKVLSYPAGLEALRVTPK